MWNRLPNIAKTLSALFIALLIPAFYGIVGNRADSTLLKLLPFFQQPISITLNRWMLVLIVLLPSLVISIPLGLTAFLYYRSQQAAINLVKLDDSLLRLLSSFKQNPDKQAATTLLFQEFLEDTLDLFRDGCRISILRPDSNKADFLTIWQSWRVPAETIQRTEFYIGSNTSKATNHHVSIAGNVFQQPTIQIVHLSWHKNQWLADNPNYYASVKRNTPKGMPYRSIVAVPIIDNTNPNQCLGVLCLDSMDRQAFDSKEVKEGLQSVADRISATLLILENYQ